MRLICRVKDTNKRLLVDTNLEPDYKEIYNDDLGKPFESASYRCTNCDKTYKTQKRAEKHLKKCEQE